jgi:predicted esterase
MSDLAFVHRWIPAQRPGLPTLLLLHGTGGDENDLVPLGRHLLPGAALLSPRGRVQENGMPRFFRRLAVGVFDLDDLHRQARALGDFIVAAADEYGFDAKEVVAVGFSNGANIAAALLLADPGALHGAILFHAQVPYRPSEQPELAGLPVFLSAGRADAMVPPEETDALAALLRDAGANVTLHWERGGHQLMAGEIDAARQWLVALTSVESGTLP